MSKVDFYVISGSTEADRDIFACRLVEKAFHKGHKIYLHAASETAAQHIDDLLWSFKPESFLPHAIDGQIDDEDVPIIIGFSDSYSGPRDVLINLCDSPPLFYSEFERISEIVRNDEAVKENKRALWNEYKQQGLEMERHLL